MKLGVGLLTYERPELLHRTVSTLWPFLGGAGHDMVAVIVDNGSAATTLAQVRRTAVTIGARLESRAAALLPAEDLEERNRRISAGFATLAASLLACDCTHALLVEDDWECRAALPLAALADHLDAHPHLGQIRLRDAHYDGTLTGCSARNFVTGEPIRFGYDYALGVATVAEAAMHWTNNPSLIRRAGLEFLATGHGSELETMRAFQRLHPVNGQLRPGAFIHLGPVRRRPELEAAGLFAPLRTDEGAVS